LNAGGVVGQRLTRPARWIATPREVIVTKVNLATQMTTTGRWEIVSKLTWIARNVLVAAVCATLLGAAGAAVLAAAPQPVEPDMHEFMEYLFQPTYRRLKLSMASAPADNAGWKAIKADSLILAEGGNLLLGRAPDGDAAAWDALSVAVRELGGQLYQAAKNKDFDTARGHYQAMLLKCNACHDQFAGGEHQLTP
jgi:hypothetical protein